MVIFEDKIKGDKVIFLSRVKEISDRLNTDVNFLMAVMYSESRLNPLASNPYSNAVGLLQFTPRTLNNLGYTVSDILAMNGPEQLNVVYQYLKPYAGKLRTYQDLYFSVFFPAAIGRPLDWIFHAKNLSASIVAQQNKIIDENKDGKITVAEFISYLRKTIPNEWQAAIFKKMSPGAGGLAVLLIGLFIYNYSK